LGIEDAPLPSAHVSKVADVTITRDSNMIISLFIIVKFPYTIIINNHAFPRRSRLYH
jgi:hypothetical protein